MNYKDLLEILNDLHHELVKNSPDVSIILLVADHKTGESRYFTAGFADVHATMLKAMIEQDKSIADAYIDNFIINKATS